MFDHNRDALTISTCTVIGKTFKRWKYPHEAPCSDLDLQIRFVAGHDRDQPKVSVRGTLKFAFLETRNISTEGLAQLPDSSRRWWLRSRVQRPIWCVAPVNAPFLSPNNSLRPVSETEPRNYLTASGLTHTLAVNSRATVFSRAGFSRYHHGAVGGATARSTGRFVASLRPLVRKGVRQFDLSGINILSFELSN